MIGVDNRNLLKVVIDANVAVVINFLFVVCMSRLMPHESNFVDEPWLIWANEAFMDFFGVVVIDHVLLEMSFVAKDFPTESTSDFIDDVRVPEVIFEHRF